MTKRGCRRWFSGCQNGILYRNLTKLDILMGNIEPHLVPNFYKKRPTDGREICDALLFVVRHVPRVPESERGGISPPKLAGR